MNIYIILSLLLFVIYRIKCLTEIITKMKGDITIKDNIQSYLLIFNVSSVCSSKCRITLNFESAPFNDSFICFGKSINFSSIDFYFNQKIDTKIKNGVLNKDGFYFGVYYSFKLINVNMKILYSITAVERISDEDLENSDYYFQQRKLYSIHMLNKDIYVHGGKSLDALKFTFIKHSQGRWSEVEIAGDDSPPCLYGHTMTYRARDSSLVLIGGRDCNVANVQYSCIWSYSLITKQWKKMCNDHVKPIFLSQSFLYKDNAIISMMGLTIDWKIHAYVQIISSDSKVHRYPGKHLAYYCAYLDAENDQIIIHGGINEHMTISTDVWSFNLVTKTWKMLSKHGPAVYMHQCLSIGKNQLLLLNGIANTSTNQNLFLIKLDHLKSFSSGQSLDSINFIGSRLLFWNSSKRQIGFMTAKGKRKMMRLSNVKWYKNTKIDYFHQTKYHRIMKLSENCHQRSTCATCTAASCIWCSLHSRCVSALEHITLNSLTPTCQLSTGIVIGSGIGPIGSQYEYECAVECSLFTYCNSCVANTGKNNNWGCTWCELRTVLPTGKVNSSISHEQLYGRGKCLSVFRYPELLSKRGSTVCKPQFSVSVLGSQCPLCHCNGRSSCNRENMTMDTGVSRVIGRCKKCLNNTAGDNCEKCRPGYRFVFENLTDLGKQCRACDCVINKLAGDCFSDGSCEGFCYENGRIGKYCDKCHVNAHFVKFLNKCAIKSTVNFRYVINETFNSISPYVERINFLLTGLKDVSMYEYRNKDPNITFHINCTGAPNAKITIELYNKVFNKTVLYKPQSCVNLQGLISLEKVASSSLLFTIFDVQTPNNTFKLSIEFKTKLMLTPYLVICMIVITVTSVILVCTIRRVRLALRRQALLYQSARNKECPIASVKLMSNYVKAQLSKPTNKNVAFLMMEPIKMEKSSNESFIGDSGHGNIHTALGSYLFTYPSQQSNSVNLMIGSLLTQIKSGDNNRTNTNNNHDDRTNNLITHFLKLPPTQLSSSSAVSSGNQRSNQIHNTTASHVSTNHNNLANNLSGREHNEMDELNMTLLDRDDFDTSVSPSGLIEEMVEITVEPSSSIGAVVQHMNEEHSTV